MKMVSIHCSLQKCHFDDDAEFEKCRDLFVHCERELFLYGGPGRMIDFFVASGEGGGDEMVLYVGAQTEEGLIKAFTELCERFMGPQGYRVRQEHIVVIERREE